MTMQTRSLVPALVVGAATMAGACGTHTAARTELAPGRPDVVAVALVDSVAWKNENSEGALHRVLVRSGGVVDTIAGILTADVPVAVDSAVLGFEYRDEAVVHAFRYDIARRRVSRLPLPRDFSPAFSAPSVSPTGEYLAYVVVPGNSTAAGVVRRWPDGPEVIHSAPVAVPPTDVALEFTRWLDPDRFEIYIDLTTEAERWQRIRGSVSTRLLRADTVAKLP